MQCVPLTEKGSEPARGFNSCLGEATTVNVSGGFDSGRNPAGADWTKHQRGGGFA